MSRFTIYFLKILKIGFPLIIGVFCVFSGSILAHAATTRTWDGGGSGNNWSTKENWSGDTVPTVDDWVVFDGSSSTKSSTIDSSFAGSMAGITIHSTYTGTLTQSRTLTIGSAGFVQAGGTFNGGSYNITLNGDFTFSGGTFKAPSKIVYINGNFTHTAGGTFTHNSGTVTFSATSGSKVFDFNTSDTFYHFTVNAPGGEMSIADGDSLIVAGTLTFVDGVVNGAYLEAQGSTTTVGAGFDGGNATLKFSGSRTNQSFSLSGAEDKYNGSIMVNKSSGTVTLFSGLTLEPGSSFYMTAGTFFPSTYNFTMPAGGTFYQQGGTFNGGSGTWDIDADLTITAGAFKATAGTLFFSGTWNHSVVTGGFNSNGGTFVFDAFSDTASSKTWEIYSSEGFYNLTIHSPNVELNLGAGDYINVSNQLILMDGAVNNGYFQVIAPLVQVGPDYDGGNTILKFNGTNAQVFDLTGAEDRWDGSVYSIKTGGTITLASDLVLQAGAAFNMYYEGGAFDCGTHNFTLPAGGAFTLSAGSFNGGSGTLDIDTLMTISGTGQFMSTSGNFYVGNNFNHSGGTFNANHGTVIFDGDILDRTFNSLESDSFYNFTIQTGTISLNGESLMVTGIFNNNGALRLRGDEILSLVSDSDSGVIELVGDADAAEDLIVIPSIFGSVYNLMFNPADGVMDTFVLSAPLEVNGDLTIASGTLDVSENSFGVIVAGNWMNYGAFLARNGTVTFDDAGRMSTIFGSHNFYNLNVTTPGKAVYFPAGGMQTILGTMTLAGLADQKVMLRSTEPGVYWGLNVVNSLVANVDVSDSDASFGPWIDAGATSIFMDHNVNWYANDPPVVSGISAAQLQDGTGIVTVSFVVDDSDLNDTVQALVEYNVGAGWQKATLSEEASTIFATHGLPAIDNDNVWPVGNDSGFIVTSSGENTISVQWLSSADVPMADVSGAQVRIVLFDGLETSEIVSSPEFALDHGVPTGLADFVSLGTTSSSIQMGWTPVADSHFDHYEIWVGPILEEVENQSGSALKWDSFHDANLTTISTSTTTIIGLLENTTYYLKIFARDAYGNKTSLPVISVNTNARPRAISFAALPVMDGGGEVVLSFTVQDLDGDDALQALVEYEVGAGWQKATLSEDPSDVTATQGFPKIENDNAYPIGNSDGWIMTSSGDNAVTVVWLSKTDVSTADLATAQFRITFYDGIEAGDATLLTDVVLDNAAPLPVADFSTLSTTSTTAQLAWTATADSHFDHYEVWVGTDAVEVESRSGSAMEWDAEDDVNLNTITTNSTSLIGLLENTMYSVQLFAMDAYHNETASSLVSFSTNATPTVSEVTATPLSHENGLVSVQFTFNDLNGQDGQALVEYTTGGEWQKATLSEYLSATTATFGIPDVENDNAYQLGNSDGFIQTFEGANTITILWDSFADEENLDSDHVQIRVTPYDGIETGETVVTDEFVMDYSGPVGMADFVLTISEAQFMGTWTPVSSESHFSHYEMWVGLSAEEVLARAGSAMEWDENDDVTMSVMGSGSTIVVGVEPIAGNTYYAGLWAVDIYGNESAPLTSTLSIPLPTVPVEDEEETPVEEEEEEAPVEDEEEAPVEEEEEAPVEDEEEAPVEEEEEAPVEEEEEAPVEDEEEAPVEDEEEAPVVEETPFVVVHSSGGGGGSSGWSHVGSSVSQEVTDEAIYGAADEVASDEVVSDEVVSDEVVSDEAVSDEPVSDEVASDEPVSDEVASDEVVSDEVFEGVSLEVPSIDTSEISAPEAIVTVDAFAQTGLSADPVSNVTFIQSLFVPAGFSLRTQVAQLSFRFLVDSALQNIDTYAKAMAMMVNQASLHSGAEFSVQQPSVNASGHVAYTPNDVSSRKIFGVEREMLLKVLCRARK